MGGVWCKTDKGQTRSYGSRGPINTAISRWTDHVRQAYRKPKAYQRPRPPQKPLRNHDRITISHPQLVTEQSSDGWRTATLLVPEAAPVPPPRKKRKRNQELTRTAFSMDDLNRVEPLDKSTISLPDKYHSEIGLNYRNSSSTLIVTPILESRIDHPKEVVDTIGNGNKENENDEKVNDSNENDLKENVIVSVENKIDETNKDEIEEDYLADEIIPIEKETLFSSRTLLQSNLGYIDKLSAISEVSTESGFDDKIDAIKTSEGSGSVTSSEGVPQESGLNIMAHIQNINNVSHINEKNKDIREKTAISKTEWLQNILKQEPEPLFISGDRIKDLRRASDSLTINVMGKESSGQPNSLPDEVMHPKTLEPLFTENSGIKTPPPSPESKINSTSNNGTANGNHSVLLDLLQKNSLPERELIPTNPFIHKEESIFLTNTKTNIIYKSLSSDKLTDDYEIHYENSHTENSKSNVNFTNCKEGVEIGRASERDYCLDAKNPFNSSDSTSQLRDYSFQSPKLVESDVGLNSLSEDKRSNVVSSFDFKEIKTSQNYVMPVKELHITGETHLVGTNPTVFVNGFDYEAVVGTNKENKDKNLPAKDNNFIDSKLNVKESVIKKDSKPSSRRSSISDSLHEFEMSIYDMLKESKKNRESSDEEESLKVIKNETRQ